MEELILRQRPTTQQVLTYGLTHLALRVKDVGKSIQFYQHVFGVQVKYRNPNFAQVCTPDTHDVIVFEKSKSNAVGSTGGIAHFGFRLKDPNDIEAITQRVIEAGGKIKEKGEFIPNEPYLFFTDPDGYDIEVWYEVTEGC